MQVGASLAKGLFTRLTPLGVTTMRLVIATLILLATVRPSFRKVTRSEWKAIFCYGLSLAGMNMSFYMAIDRIPIGIVVGIEFLGPLALSAITSRKRMDFWGIALASIGLWLLLPLGAASASLDMKGIFFALCAATGWASYIISGRKAGKAGQTTAVALGMLVAVCLVAPFGIYADGLSLLAPDMLPTVFLVGLLSSALPFVLEMIALQTIPPKTFGILMSLEPAIGALAGFIFLHEVLQMSQICALGCIISASVLATCGIKRQR